MSVLLLLTLAAAFVSPGEAQRLGQGASDWYMRFHDFDMVKRNYEEPSIR